MCTAMSYSELYSYSSEVLTNIVNSFVDKDKPYTKSNIDLFLDLVIGFENYLKNGYDDVLTHCAINSSLHEICKLKNCIDLWDIYSCEVTKS
jgi:hypothetical protein